MNNESTCDASIHDWGDTLMLAGRISEYNSSFGDAPVAGLQKVT